MSTGTRPPCRLSVIERNRRYLPSAPSSWRTHLSLASGSCVCKLGLALADIYYLNSIWRRCSSSFALNNLQSQLLHLAQAGAANLREAKRRVLRDCVTHFWCGLCNIDVLTSAGRSPLGWGFLLPCFALLAFASCL